MDTVCPVAVCRLKGTPNFQPNLLASSLANAIGPLAVLQVSLPPLHEDSQWALSCGSEKALGSF
eukprot:9492517-Heterocapsa_arctica.AAC.1